MENKFNIKAIDINNYRCFEHYSIDQFGSSTTIFIGKNGVGKTTVLRSITNLLSVFFSKSDHLGVRMLSSGNPDLTIANISPIEIFQKAGVVADSVKCSAIASFNNVELNWTISKKATNSSLSPTQYRQAYKAFIKSIDDDKNAYPLLVSFSDSFPHVMGKVSAFANKSLSKGLNLMKNFGYYQWNSESACTALWELWFQNHWFNILSDTVVIDMLNKQKQDNYSEETLEQKQNEYHRIMLMLGQISAYVSKFLKDSDAQNSFDLKSITAKYRGKQRVVLFEFINGQSLTLGQLPAGYRRLISIVFDIVVRSIILNGFNSEPTGVVLIDEIDLHLHPSLEQTVVDRFKRTFPNIQFIFTTHSPLVISNLKQDENNKIIVMEEENGDYINYNLPDQLGVDYTTIVRDAMGVKQTDNDIQTLVDDYLYLFEKGNSEKIMAFIQEIAHKYNQATVDKVKKMAEDQIKLFK